MKQTIKLYDIYSADLFTRSRASELRSSIDEKADEVTLDFEGVSFMSRSFADEVCNIIDDIPSKAFTFINVSCAIFFTLPQPDNMPTRKTAAAIII